MLALVVTASLAQPLILEFDACKWRVSFDRKTVPADRVLALYRQHERSAVQGAWQNEFSLVSKNTWIHDVAATDAAIPQARALVSKFRAEATSFALPPAVTRWWLSDFEFTLWKDAALLSYCKTFSDDALRGKFEELDASVLCEVELAELKKLETGGCKAASRLWGNCINSHYQKTRAPFPAQAWKRAADEMKVKTKRLECSEP